MFAITLNIDPEKLKDKDNETKKTKKGAAKNRKVRARKKADKPKTSDS